jgi:polyhydroxyalkanoate synthesis regulator phasin
VTILFISLINIPNQEREVPMLDEIKKGLLSGLGAVFLTKDKIERITRTMVDEAKMSKEDAQNLKEDLYKTGEKEWSELEEFFSGIIKKIMQGLDLCSRKEMDELKSRVEELEKRVGVETEQSEEESK